MKETLPLLFDTADLVAVVKPSGLATIPGRAETDSVLERLARQLNLPCTGSADPRLRVVHRLDKETSGVLLFAKNIAAQRHLSHQFQNNTVEKEYLALVAGQPPEESGEIDAPIGTDERITQRMMITKGGRPARTLYKLEKRFRRMSLLRVFPKTGKTHQIRVHLKHIGNPLAVDTLYNPPYPGETPGLFLSQFKRDYRPTWGKEERPLIGRLTLHAEKLTFKDLSGETVTLTAPLPKDFRATINQLSKLTR